MRKPQQFLAARLLVLGRALMFAALIWPVYGYSSDGNLDDTISSLYGGDGITLFDSGSPFTHAAHFQADALVELENLASSLADSTPPLPAPVSGVIYEFDPVMDDYTQRVQPSGTIFSETSETVGRGRFLLSVAAGRSEFDTLNGDDLDSITVDLAHPDIGGPGPDDPCIGTPGRCYMFERDFIRLHLDVELETSFVSIAGVYGLGPNLDIGIQIPLLYSKINVDSRAEIINHSSVAFFGDGLGFHFFDEESQDPPNSSASSSHTGIGDIRVFGKYNFFRSEQLSTAARVEFRVPTGDESNLQGLEGIGAKLTLIADANYEILGGQFSPHMNIIANKNSRFGRKSTLEHIVGAGYGREFSGRSITTFVDFKGRHTIKNKDGFSDHQYDMGVGAKLELTNRINFYGHVVVPLNRDGLRSDLSYIVGLSGTFP